MSITILLWKINTPCPRVNHFDVIYRYLSRYQFPVVKFSKDYLDVPEGDDRVAKKKWPEVKLAKNARIIKNTTNKERIINIWTINHFIVWMNI